MTVYLSEWPESYQIAMDGKPDGSTAVEVPAETVLRWRAAVATYAAVQDEMFAALTQVRRGDAL